MTRRPTLREQIHADCVRRAVRHQAEGPQGEEKINVHLRASASAKPDGLQHMAQVGAPDLGRFVWPGGVRRVTTSQLFQFGFMRDAAVGRGLSFVALSATMWSS